MDPYLSSGSLRIRVQMLVSGDDQLVLALVIAKRAKIRMPDVDVHLEIISSDPAEDEKWCDFDGILLRYNDEDFAGSMADIGLDLDSIQALLFSSFSDLLIGANTEQRAAVVAATRRLKKLAFECHQAWQAVGHAESHPDTEFETAVEELMGWLPIWIEKRMSQAPGS